jgi:hypothetical protein
MKKEVSLPHPIYIYFHCGGGSNGNDLDSILGGNRFDSLQRPHLSRRNFSRFTSVTVIPQDSILITS